MVHFSLFSISFFFFFFFFFFFLVPNQNNSLADALSIDLINATCKQCASKSTILDYGFCVTSLQAVPVSHATNLQGLVLISMELAIKNATSTVTSIAKMLVSREFDVFAIECLTDCLELYFDAITKLMDSIEAFFLEHFVDAKMLLSAAIEASTTCEEGFAEKEGEVSPLTSENYNLFELSDIAMCIINFLFLELPTK